MGQFLAENEPFPLEDQVKTLGDDELLDFWEEAQFMSRTMSDLPLTLPVAQADYERIILQELMLRSCMRGAGPR